MRYLRLSSIFLIVMFIQACANQLTVTTQPKRPPSFFVNLEQYAWHEKSGMHSQTDIDKRFHSTIMMAIDKELKAKGYSVDAVAPDYLVNFSITKGVRTKVHYRINYDGYDPSFKWNRRDGLTGPSSPDYSATGSNVEYIESETLIIDILHPGNNQLLWRSIARKDLDHEVSDERARNNIAESVRRALADFPAH
ncbi:MAG: DUF4136 domain-containing protein [Amphritea sp.]